MRDYLSHDSSLPTAILYCIFANASSPLTLKKKQEALAVDIEISRRNRRLFSSHSPESTSRITLEAIERGQHSNASVNSSTNLPTQLLTFHQAAAAGSVEQVSAEYEIT